MKWAWEKIETENRGGDPRDEEEEEEMKKKCKGTMKGGMREPELVRPKP